MKFAKPRIVAKKAAFRELNGFVGTGSLRRGFTVETYLGGLICIDHLTSKTQRN